MMFETLTDLRGMFWVTLLLLSIMAMISSVAGGIFLVNYFVNYLVAHS